jgi:preprotein translocase subunit SecE
MASEAQRRARREARRQEGTAPPRRPAPPAAGDGGGGDARPEPHPEHQRKHRGGFLRETVGELQKVEWPNQNQIIQGTVVVLVACVIVGVFLWLSDEVFRRVVQQFFLGQ